MEIKHNDMRILRIMYKRSLVLALFGLVYVDHSASQHLLSFCLLGIMNVFWVCLINDFFLLFQEFFFQFIKVTTYSGHYFIQRRIAISLSPFYSSPFLHIFLCTARRKARRFLSLSFFLFIEDGWYAVGFFNWIN